MREPCTCGAMDCLNCSGPQGYRIHCIRNNRGDYVWVNPEDEEDDMIEEDDE